MSLGEAVEFAAPRPAWPELEHIWDDSLRGFLIGLDALDKERAALEATLASAGKEMPSTQQRLYRDRLRTIAIAHDQRFRVLAALRAGYDPYTIPADFTVGFVEPPDPSSVRKFALNETPLIFNTPIIDPYLGRFIEARRNNLFDLIVVASADSSLFERLPEPPSIYVDPVMVGLINAPEFFERTLTVGERGDSVIAGFGFLITHWDLTLDLAKAPAAPSV